jgi:hypothetical protein
MGLEGEPLVRLSAHALPHLFSGSLQFHIPLQIGFRLADRMKDRGVIASSKVVADLLQGQFGPSTSHQDGQSSGANDLRSFGVSPHLR